MNRKAKNSLIVIFMSILLLVSIVLAVTFGSSKIPVSDVYRIIVGKLFRPQLLEEYIGTPLLDVVWLIRVPRILLACLVGVGLSASGLVMQAVVKNPLADPYILGVSSGAYLGAVIAIMLGVFRNLGDNYIGIAAFLGAFLVSILVLAVANIGGRSNTIKLILSGVAISSAVSALSNFIVFISNDREGMRTVTYWMMGSLAGVTWERLKVLFILTIICSVYFLAHSRVLDIMLLGDDVAITLGVDLNKYRTKFLMVVSIIVGFVVYSSGMIGFIGLLIPHLTRMIVGTGHKYLIPIASLIGGIVLIWSDVLCRILIENTEIPIGILIAIVGSPAFVFLLVKSGFRETV